MKSNKTGIKRIIDAFRYSFAGLKSAFIGEVSFRQDVLIFIIGAVAICFIQRTGVEKVVLLFSLFFILFAELVNTAIEKIIDRIDEKYHPLSKQAKDIGSALVLLSYVFAIICWAIILF